MTNLASEFRVARRDRGLSQRAVAAAAGISHTTVWRFERARVGDVKVGLLARLLAVVGLDLVARAYAGPSAARDSGHIRVINRFRAWLHSSLGWGSEVPFPSPGDPRRWDGVVSGRGWRFGVEG
jgi:transcriptional regulator with XRE-family HTH domain